MGEEGAGVFYFFGGENMLSDDYFNYFSAATVAADNLSVF